MYLREVRAYKTHAVTYVKRHAPPLEVGPKGAINAAVAVLSGLKEGID